MSDPIVPFLLKDLEALIAASSWGEWALGLSANIYERIGDHLHPDVVQDWYPGFLCGPFTNSLTRQNGRESLLIGIAMPTDPGGTQYNQAMTLRIILTKKNPPAIMSTEYKKYITTQRLESLQGILETQRDNIRGVIYVGAQIYTAKRPVLFDAESEQIKEGDRFFVQPKIDGMRAIFVIEKTGPSRLYSRHNKIQQIPPQFADFLDFLQKNENPPLVLEGELHTGRALANSSAIVAGQMHSGKMAGLLLTVFDIYRPDMPMAEYQARLIDLQRIDEIIQMKEFAAVIPILSLACSSKKEIDDARAEIFKIFASTLSLEGLIIRLAAEVPTIPGGFFKEKKQIHEEAKCLRLQPSRDGAQIVCVLLFNGQSTLAHLDYTKAGNAALLAQLKQNADYLPPNWINGKVILSHLGTHESGAPRHPHVSAERNGLI